MARWVIKGQRSGRIGALPSEVLRHTSIVGMSLVCLVAVGCRAPKRGFESPDPGERIYAVTDAARTRDPAAVPQLITMLRSDDPLVRMTSIRTLELITGTTQGYDHAAPSPEREEAIQRWVEWYRFRQGDGGDDLPAEGDLRF